MNIYVGNLAREVTEEDLQEAFKAFGQVTSATLIKDKFSGEPRGFGFIEMPGKGRSPGGNCWYERQGVEGTGAERQ